MTKTPEGYLICLGVPIARIGSQKYLSGELGINDSEPDKTYNVMRMEDEVFSPATIASFEGKPVTDDHPPESVDTGNVQAYSCGHAQNVRRGVGDERDFLIADLFITDKKLIEDIKNGRREISCGYDCEYAQDEDGKIYQKAIRGNHVAVVSAGRAGHRIAIKDSASAESQISGRRVHTNMNEAKKNSLFARLFSRAVRDMEPEEIEDAVEEMAATAAEVGNAEPKFEDAEPAPELEPEAAPVTDDPMAQILKELASIKAELAALKGTKDEAPVAEPDPLQQLEDELTVGEKPVDPNAGVPTQPMDEDPEEAVTIPAEQVNEDACKDAEEPENKEAALAAINAVKPVIANLPEGERKAASDRAVREIRKLLGRDSKPATNGYSAIAKTMNAAAKKGVQTDDEGKLGKDIMAKRNPHYKD